MSAGSASPRTSSCWPSVSAPSSLEGLAARVLNDFGAIDILVNNAAIYAGIARKPFTGIEEADWDRIMAVNVKGTWLASKIIAPKLTAQTGAIINRDLSRRYTKHIRDST